MALEKITVVRGRGVYVPGDDIDTDRIIPASYMRCVTFDGLGAHFFRDARFDESGKKREHPLNDPRFAGASILLSNRNFGCGSSREHAPQALAKAGFRAVVAESFAEIFFGNATTLGIPCVALGAADLRRLAAAIDNDPAIEIAIDLPSGEVRAGDLAFPLAIKESAREALIAGEWDPIGQLLEGKAELAAAAERLPYLRF